MRTICNKCFDECQGYRIGYTCPSCSKGILLDIAYVNFTNPDVEKLYRHPESLTLFTERGFFKKFEINACRCVSEDYLVDMPQFIPMIPIDCRHVPPIALRRILEKAHQKVESYNLMNSKSWQRYYFSDKQLISMMFINERKEKLKQIESRG